MDAFQGRQGFRWHEQDAGVEECWLVLAKKQEVEQYSDPVGGAYRKVECIRGGDTLISTALAGVSLRVGNLFP